MPPFNKRLPKSQLATTEQGLGPITQFLKPKTEAGRLSKTSSNAGRKAAPKNPDAAPAAKLPPLHAAASAEQPKAKKQEASRQNWPRGDGLKRLTEAAAKWELEAAKPAEKDRMSVRLLAEVNCIPFTTFQTHITPVDGTGPPRRHGGGLLSSWTWR